MIREQFLAKGVTKIIYLILLASILGFFVLKITIWSISKLPSKQECLMGDIQLSQQSWKQLFQSKGQKALIKLHLYAFTNESNITLVGAVTSYKEQGNIKGTEDEQGQGKWWQWSTWETSQWEDKLQVSYIGVERHKPQPLPLLLHIKNGGMS